MRKLILLIASSALSFGLLVTVTKSISGEEKTEPREKNEIAEAIEWWNDVRSNQQTGYFDPNDMYNAIDQANAMSSTRDVSIQWEEMGPDNVGGRTRAVLYDRNNSAVVYSGGVSGGLWKSTNGGDSWIQVQGLTTLTVTCLAQAVNGDIYVGTGEGFFDLGLNIPLGYAAFGFPGGGMWRSSDGGNTFAHLDATTPSINSTTSEWSFVTRIAVSPTNSNHLYAATNKGIRISDDAGTTWKNATGPSNVTYAWEVAEGSDGYVYATVGNLYFKSNDPDGDVFTNKMNKGGFPATAQGRMVFAVSPSNPSYVYVAIAQASISGGLAGVYKSTDGGENWTLIGPGGGTNFNPLGFQGNYDVTLAVLPSDQETIFLGGQFSLWKYTPTAGWYPISNWVAEFFDPSIFIHADMHEITFNPSNSSQFILGCDGGIFRCNNAADVYPNFESINRKYCVTQCYDVAARNTGEVLFGCQDNGTKYIDFLGNTDSTSKGVQGGDGMDVAISRLNQKAFFASLPAGGLTRSSDGPAASEFTGFSPFFDARVDGNGDGMPDEGADWVCPFDLWEADDTSHSFFAFGAGAGSSGHVWITLDALNFSTDPVWFRLPSVSGVVTCVTFSPDGDAVFAGTSSGSVYCFKNLQQLYAEGKFKYPAINSAATAWNGTDSGIVKTSALIGSGRYLRSVAVDPHSSNNVVVTAARYGSVSYVWRSTNALDSPMVFANITSDLPLMPVWTSCIDYVNPNLILIGTDLGVYSRDISTSSGWTEQNSGMDRVPVLRIKQVPYNGQTNYTYLGTYGRGVFRSSSLVGVKNIPVALNNISLFPNPVKDQTTLSINISQSSSLTISVFDLSGNLVSRQIPGRVSAGTHDYTLSTKAMSNGTYLVSVTSENSTVSKKMVVIK